MQKFMRLCKENWRSGLTVALVSLPLSIALAVASGATPSMGLRTAIFAGLLAALFGGSQYNIVGPAGALSGMLSAYALSYGAESLPMLALASGVLILIAFALKLERYLVLVPHSVMYGFGLGVALTIGLNQINAALDLRGLPQHEHFILNVGESIRHLTNGSLISFGVFLFFLLALFICTKKKPNIPAVVAITPFALILGALSTWQALPLHVLTLGEKFSAQTLALVEVPAFHLSPHLFSVALGIAGVAIIETLISAKIGQIMTGTAFSSRKELFGLGIASIGSGVVGGLPPTGVFVRTGLNIQSGATHQMSQAIHAIIIAVVALLFFKYVNFLPMAVIASILVFAAIRMVEVKHFKELYVNAREEFYIALFVALLMLIVDTTIGLAFGTAACLLFFIQKITPGNFEMTTNGENNALLNRYYTGDAIDTQTPVESIVYSFKGSLSYMNSEAHEERLRKGIPSCKTVILRLRELGIVDIAGVHAFDHIVTTLEAQGKTVLVTSITSPVAAMLEKGTTLGKLKEQNRVFPNTRSALGIA